MIVTFLLIFAWKSFIFASVTNSQSCLVSWNKVDIICSKIEDGQFNHVGTILTCIGSTRISSQNPESSVSSVVNEDGAPITNLSQLRAFSIGHAAIKFIPSGIKSKFQNLQALHIYNSGLLAVNKENLKEFGSTLEWIWLDGNLLTSIPADLFEYNMNLRQFVLNANPIRHIESAFFTNLKNLKVITSIHIGYTTCMHQGFEFSQGDNIETHKWNYKNCIDYTAGIETQLRPINERVKQGLSNDLCLSDQIHDSTVEILTNDDVHASSFIVSFDTLDNSIEQLKSENQEVREQISHLIRENKKLKCQINSIDMKLDNLIRVLT